MTEVYNEESLVSSYLPSPRPRRQPMTSLSKNRRSYSRLSSKGFFGDDSPLLLSPLPKYPNRRRSITFADETETTLREERPHYTMWEAGTTPNVRSSESPNGRSILTPKQNKCGADVSPTRTNQQHSAGATAVAVASFLLTPKRGRSNSRLRRIARRKEAELHHGFYDDSFVEEYVLKAKKDIEGECMEEKNNCSNEKADLQEEENDKDKEDVEEKEEGQSAAKINALKKAKEYLLSTVNTLQCSPICPSSERRDASLVPRSRRQSSRKELDLLQQVDGTEEDMEKAGEVMRQRKNKLEKCSVPLVAHHNAIDNTGPKKRIRQSSLKKGPSLTFKPLFDNAPVDVGQCSENDYDNDDGSEDADVGVSKMAKLERIIARVIKQQAKKSHGKRSVVVIDWDSVDSDKLLADDADDVDVLENDGGNDRKKGLKTKKAASGARKEAPEDKSLEPTQLPVAVSAAKQQRKPQTTASSARPALPSRNPSERRRNDSVSVSVAPDMTGDSFMLEEEQPVLLRRNTATKHHVPARSISHVSAEAGDDSVFERWADVSRQPPRRAPAPKVTRRGRKASSAFAGAPSLPIPSVSPPAAQSTDYNTPAPPPSHFTAARRQRAAKKTSAIGASADDPMAIFFDASFPSPSKFDEMMLAAGGLPETRGRAGRGHARQPALLLPENIYRRR